jgi:hypothetical protein
MYSETIDGIKLQKYVLTVTISRELNVNLVEIDHGTQYNN